MRRVEGVRLIMAEDGVWAEDYRVGHRHPITITVGVGWLLDW
jgi:hypothetical protein